MQPCAMCNGLGYIIRYNTSLTSEVCEMCEGSKEVDAAANAAFNAEWDTVDTMFGRIASLRQSKEGDE